MVRSISGTALLGALLVAGACYPSAAAQFVVDVSIPQVFSSEERLLPASLTAERHCAAAMAATAPTANIDGLVVNDKEHGSGALTIVLAGTTEASRGAAIEIAHTPYLFTDARHYLDFIRSDALKQLKQADRTRKEPIVWLALAYGGYHQLFSTDRAFTEPRHFFEQKVGGSRHAALFERLGANALLKHAAELNRENEAIEDGFKSMGDHDRSIRNHAVVATLFHGLEYARTNRARFINLTFSAIKPILFHVDGRQWQTLPADMQAKIERWLNIAALQCSNAVFESERTALDALKKGGLTIVPVNRSALLEHGWLWSLTDLVRKPERSSYRDDRPGFWTVHDLDAIVRLTTKASATALPSAVLAKLNPAVRQAVVTHGRSIAEQRSANLSAHAALSKAANSAEAIKSRWHSQLTRISDGLRARIDSKASSDSKLLSFGLPLRSSGSQPAGSGAASTCRPSPIAAAEAARPNVDGWYSMPTSTHKEVGEAIAKVKGADSAGAMLGIAANALDGRSPGEIFYMLDSLLTWSPVLREALLVAIAESFQTFASHELVLGLKTDGRTVWEDWDWLDHARAAALYWSLAGDQHALARLRREVLEGERTHSASTRAAASSMANSVKRVRLHTLNSMLEAALAKPATVADSSPLCVDGPQRP